MTGRVCSFCGAALSRRRSDARYCSGACRAAASRARSEESRNAAEEAHRSALAAPQDPYRPSTRLNGSFPSLGGGSLARAKRHGSLGHALKERLARAQDDECPATIRPARPAAARGGEAEA